MGGSSGFLKLGAILSHEAWWLPWTAALLCACGDRLAPAPDPSPNEPAPPQVEAPAPAPDPPFALPAFQHSVPVYELRMDEATLAQFIADPWTPEQPATFSSGGREWPVVVRLRGASARRYPKKSWRVDFGEARFDGRSKLNLISEWQDATLLVEKMAYDLLAAMRVPAPRATLVRLSINSRFEGVYLDLERVDKHFLDAHEFADDDANIYRCGNKDCEVKTWRAWYQKPWDKKTNEGEGSDDLFAFVDAVSFTPGAHIAATLERLLALELYLRAMAVDALMSNNTIQDSESYFIHDRVQDKWFYAPWDHNNGDARWWPSYGVGVEPVVDHPLFVFSLTDPWMAKQLQKLRQTRPDTLPFFSNLNARIVFDPALRARLFGVIERALTEVFHPGALDAWIDAHHALLAPWVAQDPYLDEAKFIDGRRYLKEFVRGRAAFVRAELERWRRRRPGLAIANFDAGAGWVEIRNQGDSSVHLGGKVLTANLRDALRANLPNVALAPGETLRVGLPLPARGELGIFDGVSEAGAIDVVFYGGVR